MKVKSIEVSNYRKIINAKINMEDCITVLAGANNSGKTSLVELFDSVFSKSKGKLSLNKNDFPVESCEKWSKKAYPLFYSAFMSCQQKEETIMEIREKILESDNPVLMLPITIKIQIDYDKDNDDIRNFADYIMELSLENTSFYFEYKFELNTTLFLNKLDQNYDKLLSRFRKANDEVDSDNKAEHTISEMLINLYAASCVEEVCFCDSLYANCVPMDISLFKSLFNFGHITASRTLDDEHSDKSRILSKNMIDIASQTEDWQCFTQNLPDQIIQPIQDAKIQDKVRTASLDPLKGTMEAVSQTNGGRPGEIVIDMDITEEAVNSLLKNITSAKYKMGDYFLNESSQGLGYSNLIYIHLQLEKYKKTMNPLVVNFFVIEEPEAHMHPQMQNAFAQYLFTYYKDENGIQGMLTTHSHEVVRNATISQLRVLRQTAEFTCELFDLRIFQNSLESKPDVLDFYNWFYTINFPDLIFADKIIMYEGDTERMLIKSVLRSDEFKTLRNQYISFVQVGGAYACNYLHIVNYLRIKAIILTDIDYEKTSKCRDDVLASTITNPTIKHFYKLFHNQSVSTNDICVEELYDWKLNSCPIVLENVYLGFQGEKDNLSRTLEEAMLSVHYGINALDGKSKNEWNKLRDNDKLKFSIPEEDISSIRDIVISSSRRKTDFMYSVIMNKLELSMLPDYIKEALVWLMQ